MRGRITGQGMKDKVDEVNGDIMSREVDEKYERVGY